MEIFDEIKLNGYGNFSTFYVRGENNAIAKVNKFVAELNLVGEIEKSKIEISESCKDDLINKIYESLISNPDFGLGEMAGCRDEAERIVIDWIEDNKITVL